MTKKQKPSIPGWPKIWVNKKDKTKKFRVMPWWECLDPIVTEEDIGEDLAKGRKLKIGAIVQVGWLLENEHGIWFGVGPKAEKEFMEVKK